MVKHMPELTTELTFPIIVVFIARRTYKDQVKDSKLRDCRNFPSRISLRPDAYISGEKKKTSANVF